MSVSHILKKISVNSTSSLRGRAIGGHAPPHDHESLMSELFRYGQVAAVLKRLRLSLLTERQLETSFAKN